MKCYYWLINNQTLRALKCSTAYDIEDKLNHNFFKKQKEAYITGGHSIDNHYYLHVDNIDQKTLYNFKSYLRRYYSLNPKLILEK